MESEREEEKDSGLASVIGVEMGFVLEGKKTEMRQELSVKVRSPWPLTLDARSQVEEAAEWNSAFPNKDLAMK